MNKICILFFLLFAGIGTVFSKTIYVSAAALGGEPGNGKSWSTAFTSLQAALQAASYGDVIWVGKGTYYPGSTSDKTFEVSSGIALYGGFNGTEAFFLQRDVVKNKTILDGDIGISGDTTDNTYRLLEFRNPDSLSVLDGFTIQNAKAMAAAGSTD